MTAAPFTEADALSLYHHTVVGQLLADQPTLTTRQQAILLTIALTPGPHELRDLADKLNLQKPCITRALGKLETLGFVRRNQNPEDRRVPLFSHTLHAMEWLNAMSKLVVAGMVLALPQDNP